MAQMRLFAEAPAAAGSADTSSLERAAPVKPVKSSSDGYAPRPLSSGAVKSCTQCGTTKTPQWREGPLGPKTLCNACGVKIFRANKKIEKATRPEENKFQRKVPSTSGMKRKAADAMRPLKAPLRFEDDGYMYEPTTSGQYLAKRPLRKAAARATARSYEYATLGEWGDEEYSGMTHGSYTESGVSHQASDSAEEVVFEPQRYDSPLAPAAPGCVAPETQAAVDLLTLSLRDADAFNNSALHPLNAANATPTTAAAAAATAAAAASTACEVDASPAPTATAEQPQPPAAAAAPAPAAPDSRAAPVPLGHPVLDHCAAGLLEFQLPESVPEEKRYQAVALRGQLEAAFRQVSAADAAVRAVARILAQKQDESRGVRHRAQRAANMLTSYLLALDEEYGLTKRSGADQ